MAIKVVNSARDLSQTDRWSFMNLLSWGQRAILGVAPYMEQKLLDDLLKAARDGKNPAVVSWLAEHGYRVSTPTEAGVGTDTPTASQSTAITTGIKTGDLIQVPNLRGGIVQRYAFIDDNGDTWGLATKGDLATADYLKEGDNWTYVTTDPTTNKIISPSKTGQYYDPLYGQWKTLESTDMFNIDPNAPLSPEAQANMENTQADTAYRNALTQQLLADLNSPTTTDSQKNDAAMQLYNIMSNYANQNNQNAVSQWGNQAGAFNNAYQNAIAQNQQLMEMSTQPINTIAYLNRVRGQTPPDWQIPNYQQMPDAFTGWNQQQPTTQSLPSADQIKSILGELGLWGNPTPTPTTPPTSWGNVPSPVTGQKFSVPVASSNQANAMNAMASQLSNWKSNVANNPQPTTTPSKGYTQTDYGSTGTVNDTLAVLKAANPGVNYYVGPDGKIKVG